MKDLGDLRAEYVTRWLGWQEVAPGKWRSPEGDDYPDVRKIAGFDKSALDTLARTVGPKSSVTDIRLVYTTSAAFSEPTWIVEFFDMGQVLGKAESPSREAAILAAAIATKDELERLGAGSEVV